AAERSSGLGLCETSVPRTKVAATVAGRYLKSRTQRRTPMSPMRPRPSRRWVQSAPTAALSHTGPAGRPHPQQERIAGMATMLAARLDTPGKKMEMEQVEVPEPKRGQVRVKVMAAGVCLSDVHLIDGTAGGPTQLPKDTRRHETTRIHDTL